MVSSTSSAIETRNLSKHFRVSLRRKVIGLDKLNFVVRENEVYGLLGPNGSGKSTTIKLILGLYQPTEGEARLFGMNVESVSSRVSVGFLPENPYFYKYLSGEETVRFFGRLCGMRGRALEDKVSELIAMVGLERHRHRRLGGYSKGMLQRIGLAQAMVQDPKLLLLDEPTAGVDPIGSIEIRDMILKLKKMGKTILLCSHLLDQVQDVCDRIGILQYGKMILEGDVKELLTRKDQYQYVIEGLSQEARSQIGRQIGDKGGRILREGSPQTTLEQLFLQTVRQGDNRQEGI
ncbi:MAG: ABC transporter ATP-binding protein [Verrucomicrobiae bacterium]|nr:ABC transporter ATP-binding protein [Verrucomicrobiae bacterium]